MTIGFLLLAVMSHWIWGAVGCAVGGFGFYTFHNNLQVSATQLLDTGRGTAVSLFACSIFLGQSIGVVTAAISIARLGHVVWFLIVALVLAWLGQFFSRQLRVRSDLGHGNTRLASPSNSTGDIASLSDGNACTVSNQRLQMITKRLEGRSDPIVDPDMRIIDAHHHLFDRPTLRYMFDDYLQDARAGHNIVASVYVETQAFTRPYGAEMMRPLGEVEFANGMAAMAASGVYGSCRVAAAIVGYADLRAGDQIACYLDRALEVAPDRLRGIRQVTMDCRDESHFRFFTQRPPQGILQSRQFFEAFRHLKSRNLSFDAAVFHYQIPDLIAIADSFPDTTIVLNHAGIALGIDLKGQARSELFADWRISIRDLARRPNVICKIGGFGMPFWGFDFHDRPEPVSYMELTRAWKPFIDFAVEEFGASRCMMESNFPPDGRSCGFVPLWNALKESVHSYSVQEKAALFHEVAARTYRISLPDSPDTGER